MQTIPVDYLLVVDGDRVPVVANALERQWHVQWVATAAQANQAVRVRVPLLMIANDTLPGGDGLALLRDLKRAHPQVPVILTSASHDRAACVHGLEQGADDFLAKPVVVAELVARVKARLRGVKPVRQLDDGVVFGDVRLDLNHRVLWKHDQSFQLTTHEAGTLGLLIAHRGQTVTREQLLDRVWGYSKPITTRTVDNQILKLRKKIEDDPHKPKHLLTVHGVGYRFEG